MSASYKKYLSNKFNDQDNIIAFRMGMHQIVSTICFLQIYGRFKIYALSFKDLWSLFKDLAKYYDICRHYEFL